MNFRSIALIASLAILLPQFAHSQDTTDIQKDELTEAELDALIQAYSDSVEASYSYTTGTVELANGVATLTIPEGFKFLDAAQSQQVIVEVWGNPPSVAEGILGMILRTEDGVEENAFAFVVEYDAMGYVSDDDADDIDYTEMMQEMKKDDEENNRMRREAGYDGLELIGWAAPPYYDKGRKVLHWAKELHADDAEYNTLNYNVRVLGRKGVLILNAVADMEDLPAVEANIPAVLDMASFNPGHTYEEFDSNLDEVAVWTVGGLVAGKVLAKAGILALLLKNIKLVLLAFAAIGGGLWKFLSGRKKDDTPSDQA
jgi:uncharacterized membrane-anchored protein